MDNMNRDINILNLDCEVVCFHNANCRLTVPVDGSRSIGDLEVKVLLDGLEPLDHFSGQVEGPDLGVC